MAALTEGDIFSPEVEKEFLTCVRQSTRLPPSLKDSCLKRKKLVKAHLNTRITLPQVSPNVQAEMLAKLAIVKRSVLKYLFLFKLVFLKITFSRDSILFARSQILLLLL